MKWYTFSYIYTPWITVNIKHLSETKKADKLGCLLTIKGQQFLPKKYKKLFLVTVLSNHFSLETKIFHSVLSTLKKKLISKTKFSMCI